MKVFYTDPEQAYHPGIRVFHGGVIPNPDMTARARILAIRAVPKAGGRFCVEHHVEGEAAS